MSAEAIAQIKGALAIEDVVGGYLELRPSGTGYKALCPMHEERTPSFYVSPERGSFHCFGCGEGGDLFDFVQHMEGVAFPEALRMLAERAGVDFPDSGKSCDRLYAANAAAAAFWHQDLMAGNGILARNYLRGRSFGGSDAKRFLLGRSPGLKESAKHLRSLGFTDRELLAAGLVYEKDGVIFDRFSNRLMFPIRTPQGKIAGFGGRSLTGTQPKYLNTGTTDAFDKSGLLFGLPEALEAIRERRRAIVVEGYMDVLRAHQQGFPETVGSMGTAVTARQLRLLSRSADQIVLALDCDAAGETATLRTILAALAAFSSDKGRRKGEMAGIDLRIAALPKGAHDPDLLILGDPEAFRRAVEEAVPAFDYYYDHAVRQCDHDSPGWRQGAIDTVLPVIRDFIPAGWQVHWLEQLAGDTGVDVSALSAQMKTMTASAPVKADVPEVAAADRLERDLMIMLIKRMSVPVVPNAAVSDFTRPAHRQMATELLATIFEEIDYPSFRERLPEGVRDLADEYRTAPDPAPMTPSCIAHYWLTMQHRRLMEQIKRASAFVADMPEGEVEPALEHLQSMLARRQEMERQLRGSSSQAMAGVA